MKAVLYAQVSTADQTIAHQRRQAEGAGFTIDEVVSDEGVSTRLAERPQGRRLFDLLRRGDVLVVRWVDRLGRNYSDVTDTIREFMRRGVAVRTVINGLAFDGATQIRCRPPCGTPSSPSWPRPPRPRPRPSRRHSGPAPRRRWQRGPREAPAEAA